MCLAVPMQLTERIDEDFGKVTNGAVAVNVNLMMIPHAKVGDFIIVHAGFGIEVLDMEEAQIRIELFKELAAVQDQLEGL